MFLDFPGNLMFHLHLKEFIGDCQQVWRSGRTLLVEKMKCRKNKVQNTKPDSQKVSTLPWLTQVCEREKYNTGCSKNLLSRDLDCQAVCVGFFSIQWKIIGWTLKRNNIIKSVPWKAHSNESQIRSLEADTNKGVLFWSVFQVITLATASGKFSALIGSHEGRVLKFTDGLLSPCWRTTTSTYARSSPRWSTSSLIFILPFLEYR